MHNAGQENKELVPLVIVDGFLGGIGFRLWGNFLKYCNDDLEATDECRKVIFARVGPVSSLHDRACELFYALRGGIVDYGEEHSRLNNHLRYGRHYPQGLYSEWSRSRPLHFFGHSLGGPTIVKLQWLISTGFFGENTHPDMVLSVTAVSAPFRGTQAVYILGERADAAPAVRPFSVGSLIAKSVHVASYFAPYLPSFLDMYADARGLSCNHSSVWSLVKHLWRSEWAEGRDAAPFDVTFQASDEREGNLEGMVSPRTFYRSYAACMTQYIPQREARQSPSFIYALLCPVLYKLSSSIGSFNFETLHPKPKYVRQQDSALANYEGDEISQEDLLGNDGVVPVFSQWHPFSCSHTQCRHQCELNVDLKKRNSTVPEPGIWYTYQISDATHISLVPVWFGTSRQRDFWMDVGRWLKSIDKVYKTMTYTA